VTVSEQALRDAAYSLARRLTMKAIRGRSVTINVDVVDRAVNSFVESLKPKATAEGNA